MFKKTVAFLNMTSHSGPTLHNHPLQRSPVPYP